MTPIDLFDEPEGATPLSPEDLEGLIPTWIATHGDLNIAEQDNVAKAVAWTMSKGAPKALVDILAEPAMRELHRRMFGDVWRWAGKYRRSGTNIGVPWPQIPVQLRDLLADVRCQTADSDLLPWPPDEIAVRFHHRLVVVHPFPNGNGRHARLAADMVVKTLGRPVFTWGARSLNVNGVGRSIYLEALRRADSHGDFEPLAEFARS